jgi:hypothetical protein
VRGLAPLTLYGSQAHRLPADCVHTVEAGSILVCKHYRVIGPRCAVDLSGHCTYSFRRSIGKPVSPQLPKRVIPHLAAIGGPKHELCPGAALNLSNLVGIDAADANSRCAALARNKCDCSAVGRHRRVVNLTLAAPEREREVHSRYASNLTARR